MELRDPPVPDGVYTVISPLAMGAMGWVSLARTESNELAVIKRMHRHCATDWQLVQMFHHEARLLGTLDHPGVVKLREFAKDADGLLLVTEYVPGLDLTELLFELPFASAVELVLQLLTALSAVHTLSEGGESLSVVHRDVCPANVRVTRDGAVKLLDFGIATSAWRADPDRGLMKGTRGYMAPEVITAECQIDARVDVFAAAVILYELTVGKRLYEGTTVAVMTKIVESQVTAPSELIKGYPAGLEAVLMRALSRRAVDRYQTAEQMALALSESMLSGFFDRCLARKALSESVVLAR